MLSPEAASSISKPEDVIKETMVRLLKESDNLGYSQKVATEVESEILQQAKTEKTNNAKMTDLDSIVVAVSKLAKNLMMLQRLNLGIQTKILTTLLKQLSEAGYAEAVKELRSMHIQDVDEDRQWMSKKFRDEK